MATIIAEPNTGPTPRNTTLGKVRTHPTQNEGLVFEKSSPGKRAYKLAPLDVPPVDLAELLGAARRDKTAELPELSESRSFATSPASPPGTTPSTSACIRSAPAP